MSRLLRKTIDALLDNAAAAVGRLDWKVAAEAVQTALELDPNHADARTLQQLVINHRPLGTSSDAALSDRPGRRSPSMQTPTVSSIPSDQPIRGAAFPIEQSANGAGEQLRGWGLGLDFGTTNTRIAIIQSGETPLVVPIGTSVDRFLMPSVAAVPRDASRQMDRRVIIVGENADDLESNPEFIVIRNIKRLLVPDPKGAVLPSFFGSIQHHYDSSHRLFRIDGFEISVDQLVSRIIAEAFDRAWNWIETSDATLRNKISKESFNILPLRMGIWAPAGLSEREALARIVAKLRSATPSPARVSAEPILAAFAYERYTVGRPEINRTGRTLIVDLGGGTLDVAVTETTADGKPLLLATAGDPFLGGVDIDHAVESHFRGQAAKALGIDLAEVQKLCADPVVAARLQKQARVAKELACSEMDYAEPFMFGRDMTVNIMLNASDLETIVNICRPAVPGGQTNQPEVFLKRLTDVVFGCVANAETRLSVSQARPDRDLRSTKSISTVVLVGGAALMPVVKNHLAKFWPGKEQIRLERDRTGVVHPLNAIVMGAALKSGSNEADLVLDRPRFSIWLQRRDRNNGIVTKDVIYPAFSRTSRYEHLTTAAGITYDKFPLPKIGKADGAELLLLDVDGHQLGGATPITKVGDKLFLRITTYAELQLWLVSDAEPFQTIPNPDQLDLQKVIAQELRNKDDIRRKEQTDKRDYYDRPKYPFK